MSVYLRTNGNKNCRRGCSGHAPPRGGWRTAGVWVGGGETQRPRARAALWQEQDPSFVAVGGGGHGATDTHKPEVFTVQECGSFLLLF